MVADPQFEVYIPVNKEADALHFMTYGIKLSVILRGPHPKAPPLLLALHHERHSNVVILETACTKIENKD